VVCVSGPGELETVGEVDIHDFIVFSIHSFIHRRRLILTTATTWRIMPIRLVLYVSLSRLVALHACTVHENIILLSTVILRLSFHRWCLSIPGWSQQESRHRHLIASRCYWRRNGSVMKVANKLATLRLLTKWRPQHATWALLLLLLLPVGLSSLISSMFINSCTILFVLVLFTEYSLGYYVVISLLDKWNLA